MGHEIAGEVMEIGSNVDSVAIGDRAGDSRHPTVTHA
jgi:D-arabinose 1-dehydrogenase-like Zn-dependent alcohol dehydrogenase